MYTHQKVSVSTTQNLAPTDGKSYRDGVLPLWMRPKPPPAKPDVVVEVKAPPDPLVELDCVVLDTSTVTPADSFEVILPEPRKPVGISSIHQNSLEPAQLQSRPAQQDRSHQHASSTSSDNGTGTYGKQEPKKKELTVFEKIKRRIARRRRPFSEAPASIEDQLNPKATKPPPKHFWRMGLFRLKKKIVAFREKRRLAGRREEMEGASFTLSEMGSPPSNPNMSFAGKMFKSVQDTFTHTFGSVMEDDIGSEDGGHDLKQKKPARKPLYNPFRKQMEPKPKKSFGFGATYYTSQPNKQKPIKPIMGVWEEKT